MIINHTHRFIFVHIPKCGGTSVTNVLSKLSQFRDLELGGTAFGEAIAGPYLKRFGLRKHSDAREIITAIGRPTWNEYLTFTLVRHPMSRAISTYRFLKRWRAWQGSDVMETFGGADAFFASDFWTNTDGPDGLFRAQIEYTVFEGRQVIDEIGHIETSRESLDGILSRIGLPPLAHDLPVSNASGQDEAVQLSSSSRARIAARYAGDYAAFGYSNDR